MAGSSSPWWRGRWTALVFAVAFLALAGLLQRSCETDEASDAVVFPRQRARRPPPPAPAEPEDPVPADAPQPRPTLVLPAALPVLDRAARLDPVRRAIGPAGQGALMLDLSAIAHSDLARRMLRCRGTSLAPGLEKLRESTGLDLERDVDQIGFGGGVMAVSGRLSGLRMAPQPVETAEVGGGLLARGYGPEAHPDARLYVVQVDEGVMLTGAKLDALRQAVARLQGRAPATDPLPRGRQGVDMVGRMPASMLHDALGERDDPLLQRMSSLLSEVSVSMSVGEDVAFSLDLAAPDDQTAEDLSRSVAGALSLARVEANRRGDKEMARLLAQARVLPGKGAGFGIDLALPGPQLLEMLGCDPEGRPLAPADPPELPAAATPPGA